MPALETMKPASPPYRVLLVDDEVKVLNGLGRSLSEEPFQITTTTSPVEAMHLLESQEFAVIVTDQQMPQIHGVQLLEHAQKVSPDTVRLILTGHAHMQSIIDAINHGSVYRFLTKPCSDHDLQQTLRQAIRHFELTTENRRLQELTQGQLEDLRRLNSELVESRHHELTIGARIQQTLLEGEIDPLLTGDWDAAALAVPSQRIDGDFFDFFHHGPSCFDLVVGDVMGKGVPAALLGAAAKTRLVRAMAALKSADLPEPEQIISQVHRLLTPQLMELESFVTLCYARFDLQRRQISLVDCGHTRVLHYRRAGSDCVALQGANLPLGFSASEEYRQVTAEFGWGDRFLFYSDGVTEARNPAGEYYGEQRLNRWLCRFASRTPQELTKMLREEVVGFTAQEALADDLTCVAVALGPSPHRVVLEGRLEELERVRRFVSDLGAREFGNRLDQDRLDQLMLAADEAYANIIQHGHRGRPAEPIAVSADTQQDAALIRFSYRGPAFDPSEAAQPSFDGSRSSGFGLYIIRQSVDRVTYDGDGEFQTITLWKNLTVDGPRTAS